MEQIEIYKKLKQLRKERGLTLNSFAEKIGSDYQQVSRIERGKSKLSIDMLMKMADALETPIADLVPSPEKKVVREQASHERLLAIVLEKMPEMNAATKAALASQIYSQSLQAEEPERFIDFCMGLIKTSMGL